MKELTILGGKPVRNSKIYYGRQNIDEDDIQAVRAVLQSDWLTQGPQAELLEKKLSAYTGSKSAVLSSSGTSALHLACIAANISSGDEVITTPLTFAATANCILYCGGTVKFADVNPETYNIELDKVRKLITSNTKAVIAVDYAGLPVELNELKQLCSQYNLILIEDAAHSIGSRYYDNMIGSIADMTTFSFHPVKSITGGEGGAVLTNQKKFEKILRLAASHGITKNINDFTSMSEGSWYYEEQMLGYNFRLSEIQAALIKSQLDKLESFKKRRQEITGTYHAAFSGLSGIKLQKEPPYADICRHLYTIQIVPESIRCSRKEFFEALEAENIQPQVHYIPVYWHPYYQSLGFKKGLCPNAEKIYETILSLPIYPAMTKQDICDVIDAVTKVHNYFIR